MSKGAADRWARKKWYCRICFVEVAQGHRARHQKTAAHLLNEKEFVPTYEIKESDKEFSRFIERTGVHVLTGREQALYLIMVHPELENIFEEDHCDRGPHLRDLTVGGSPQDLRSTETRTEREAA